VPFFDNGQKMGQVFCISRKTSISLLNEIRSEFKLYMCVLWQWLHMVVRKFWKVCFCNLYV